VLTCPAVALRIILFYFSPFSWSHQTNTQTYTQDEEEEDEEYFFSRPLVDPTESPVTFLSVSSIFFELKK
jgi:hypothetical protein